MLADPESGAIIPAMMVLPENRSYTTFAFRILFLLMLVATAVPIWMFRVVPMQDIWQHLALVDVIHNYNAPGSIFSDFFLLPDTPKPNLLYYYGTHLLTFLTGDLEVSNKVVLTIYAIALPVSYLYFLQSFAKSRWLAFFVFPFVYNAMFAYGFVSFLLAIPLAFFALGAYRRFAVSPDSRNGFRSGVIAALLLVLSFFTHAHIFLLICFLWSLLFLMHVDGGVWGALRRLAPFAPAMIFFLPWFFVYFVEHTPSTSGMNFGSLDRFFGGKFYRPSQIIGSFFFYVGDYFRRETDDALFVGLMLTAMTFLMLRRGVVIPQGASRKLRFYDLEILTLLVAASVLLLPQHIEAQSIVSLRHILFALLLFFGWFHFEDAPRRVAIPAILILVGLHAGGLANVVRGFSDFEQEMDGYPALFDRVEGGKRLLKVTYNQESRVVNHGAYWHMHFFHTFLKGGVSDLQFAEYPHNPIQYRPGMVPPNTGVEFFKHPAWRYYDYILLRKSSLPNLKTVKSHLELIAENDDWMMHRVLESPLGRGPETEVVANERRKEFNQMQGQTNSEPQRGDRHAQPAGIIDAFDLPGPRELLRGRGDRPAGVRRDVILGPDEPGSSDRP
jgi:hypothetical protein